MVALLCFILPTVIPVYAWGESAFIAFYVAAVFRYTFTLNSTWWEYITHFIINVAYHRVFFILFAASKYSILDFIRLINSAAHMFGYKPYDATISPVESAWTNLQAVGEGGHNFHHSFPQVYTILLMIIINYWSNQDYRASEFSHATNWTRAIIDGLAHFGLVYDRKTVSDASIKSLREKKGDKTGHWHH